MPKDEQPQEENSQAMDASGFKEALAAWAEKAGYGKMVSQLLAPAAGSAGDPAAGSSRPGEGGRGAGERGGAERRSEGSQRETDSQSLVIVEMAKGITEEPSSKKRRHVGDAAFEVDDFDFEDPDQVAKVRLLAARIEAAQQDGRMEEEDMRPRSPARKGGGV